MSIVIKTPALPQGASEARVSHWFKAVNEVVARGEVLTELLVFGKTIHIQAPQAGILERIFIPAGEIAKLGSVLAQLRSGLPDLTWNEQEKTLYWNIYSSQRDESKQFELRQLIRAQEGKLGKGFGNGLALPKIENSSSLEAGEGYEQAHQQQFKNHPAFAKSQQMSGDFKDPRVRSIPANEAARKDPQNAPTLGASPRLGPSAPTPRPMK